MLLFLFSECDSNILCHALVHLSPSPPAGGGGGDSEPPAGPAGAVQGRRAYYAWKQDSHLPQPGRSVCNSGGVWLGLIEGSFSIFVMLHFEKC